jgi:hypothetical protein
MAWESTIQDLENASTFATQRRMQESSNASDELGALSARLKEVQKRIPELQNRIQEAKDSQIRFRRHQLVPSDNRPCEYGVAMVVARRFRDGKEVEYWRETLDAIAEDDAGVVAVLNKLGRPLDHKRVTHIFVPQNNTPPEFDEAFLGRPLKRTYDDSPERVRWRSTIVLDFVRVVRFVSEQCKNVVWIEDDARLPPEWSYHVQRINSDPRPWAFQFLSKGMPGVLIRSSYAYLMLQYLTHHFDEEPVDWAITNAVQYLSIRLPGTNTKVMEFGVIGHRGEVSSLDNAAARPVF